MSPFHHLQRRQSQNLLPESSPIGCEPVDRGPSRSESFVFLAFAGILSILMTWGWTWNVVPGGWNSGQNDYVVEAQAPLTALIHGHVLAFLNSAPIAYAGSLILRAPFALIGSLAGGGPLLVYRLAALPCLLAAGAFGWWLQKDMRKRGGTIFAAVVIMLLAVASPLNYQSLLYGHPEEILGAILCVSAVLLAQRDHAFCASLVLGLTIANKEWGLLAVAPVLVALPSHRLRALAVAAVIAACFYVPLLLASKIAGGSAGLAAATAVGGGAIFQPWQVWWFLGHHGQAVRDAFGNIKPGYRTASAWAEGISHPLVAASGIIVPVLATFWHRVYKRAIDPLLLLTFLFLLRCALDTWDIVYYTVPFLMALLAWEVTRWRRPPVLTVLASLVIWSVFVIVPEFASPDMQSVAFLVAAIPTMFVLGSLLLRYSHKLQVARLRA